MHIEDYYLIRVDISTEHISCHCKEEGSNPCPLAIVVSTVISIMLGINRLRND